MSCPRSTRHTLLLAATLAILATTAPAQVATLVGYDDLVARVGQAAAPTGAGVIAGQIEAGNPGSYGPNQSLPEFGGKTFVPRSGLPGSFGHATTVGRNLYGAVNGSGQLTSIAPGIGTIDLWTTNDWLQNGFLRTGSGSLQPAIAPAGLKVFNHSWVGSFGATFFDNDALRRADLVMQRDRVLMVSGTNNGTTGNNFPMMTHTYNGIAVGRMDGNHVSGPTLPGIDGPGRMKPEIVAPGSATSFATPVVSAAVALLTETARTHPDLSSNPGAESPEVLKAALFAGATHRSGWSNAPQTGGPGRGIATLPLDPVYGVDLLNVDASHLVLTGGEQEGDLSVPTVSGIGRAGWDLATASTGTSRYWRFTLDDPAAEVSIIATWMRRSDPFFTTSTVADFDLELWRVNAQGNLEALVGPGGLAWFSGGNVASRSPRDNVEHLYVRDLQPGDYVLELARVDALPALWDVAVAWLLPGPPYPGSGEDLDLHTQVNATGNPRQSLKTVAPGDVLTVTTLSPGGTFAGAPPLLVGELYFPTVPPLGPIGLPELHVDPAAMLVIFDGTPAGPLGFFPLPSSGLTFFFQVPPGFSGNHFRFQAVAFSAAAGNGLFAATPARDIAFQ